MALLEIKSQFTELFSIINESATKVWDSSMSLLKPLPERIVTMIFQEVKSNRAQSTLFFFFLQEIFFFWIKQK